MAIHLRAREGDYAEACLLPGDPQRARYIAEAYLDGAELATAATAARPGLKVVLMSGYAWASKAGKDILIKPAHPDELRARISAVLG